MTLHEPWPPAGTCDLARAFEALSGGVLQLEGALVAGRLARELEDGRVRAAVGPAIVESYAALARARETPHAGDRRRATVRRLLEETRAELARLERTFPAEFVPESFVPGRGLPSSARLCVAGDPPVILRLDQAIAARFWGIGFHFERDADADLLARAILRDSARGLAVDLSDLNRILARIREDARFPPLVPTLDNRAFERLMLDVLNEHRRAAVQAPLVQDYSQKTDLRYDTEHGLGRQRGARVQVTSLTDLALHQKKLEGIQQRDKLVLLSPVELASWVDAEVHGRGPFHAPLAPELLARLWDVLGRQADVRELADAFGKAFHRALREPTRSPLGPLAGLPEPVRALVREWVDRSALRSTRLLRAYEDRFGQESARSDGRLARRHAPPPSTPAAEWAAFLAVAGPGRRVVAHLERGSRAGLWARCEGGIEAFVLTGRPREAWPAAGTTCELVLLDASHERRWFTAAFPDEDPALVVLGARPTHAPARRAAASDAAWSSPEAARLAPGQRHSGRVVVRKPIGLLVELPPGVLGLLHVAALAGRGLDEFDEGTELEVLLVRVDLAGRRIDLAL